MSKAKILVVDDSSTNRMLLQFTLEELGYEVDEAKEGGKAVEMALEENYVAAFMDINMPGMGGVEALQMLKSLNYASPIIACSAEDDFEAVENFLKLGFAAFVPKPIEPDGVADTLSQLEISTELQSSLTGVKHQEKVRELSDRFVNNLPVVIDKLDCAIKSKDMEKLRRFSHKLKANAGQFGFEKIGVISKDLESACLNSQWDTVIQKAKELLFELHKINEQRPLS